MGRARKVGRFGPRGNRPGAQQQCEHKVLKSLVRVTCRLTLRRCAGGSSRGGLRACVRRDARAHTGRQRGLTATTHPAALQELEPYCAKVVRARIVDQGPVVTAGGVSTSIDLGLHIVTRLAGEEARVKIARQMDYPYEAQGIVRA